MLLVVTADLTLLRIGQPVLVRLSGWNVGQIRRLRALLKGGFLVLGVILDGLGARREEFPANQSVSCASGIFQSNTYGMISS